MNAAARAIGAERFFVEMNLSVSVQSCKHAAMAESSIAFIAFNQGTGKMLGHGQTAAEALTMAGLAAPGDDLIAFRVRAHGDWFWVAKLPLHQAKSVFEAVENG
jgi:hypothetical protein